MCRPGIAVLAVEPATCVCQPDRRIHAFNPGTVRRADPLYAEYVDTVAHTRICTTKSEQSPKTSMVARVVLLNGVGSAGKTSIAKALQSIARAPFLHVQMDAFLHMLPDAMIGHHDGLVFEPMEQDGKPVVAIRSGPVAERAFRGMRHSVAALAAQGNDLIVDEVLLGAKAREYTELLSSFRSILDRSLCSARHT